MKRRLSVSTLCLSMFVVAGYPLGAQGPLAVLFGGGKGTSADSIAASQHSISPDSPRASVSAFLDLTDNYRFEQAAWYLDLPDSMRVRGPELARKLRTVLDQKVWLDIGTLSAADTDSITTNALDTIVSTRLGVVTGSTGLPEAIVLQRFSDDRLVHWRFDRTTVLNIDSWHAQLPENWIKARSPEVFLRHGPAGIQYWQWLTILAVLAISFALSALAVAILRKILAPIVLRTSTEWDDLVIGRLKGPFRLWVFAVLASPSASVLAGLNTRLAGYVDTLGRALILAAFFWALLRVLSISQDRLLASARASGQAQVRTLVPLLSRFIYVSVATVAVLVILSQLGYPVGALLAGVGIGGVALALASQKTVEHLFGSVSLAADKVLRVGERIRVGETEGVVERIGLRSTSIRTSSRTVVRIPNGRLADERVETFAERDRYLFQHDISLVHETSVDQLRSITRSIKQLLSNSPFVSGFEASARVIRLSETSIVMRISAYFNVLEGDAFLKLQHEALLSIMQIVHENGSAFTAPPQSIRIDTTDKGLVSPIDSLS